jgi:bifunctional NMN adenylyltransferase/nudix hydrolase
MIQSIYEGKPEYDRILFAGINDYTYNDQKWTKGVQMAVDGLINNDGGNPDTANIAITGNKKDESSYYLDLFPQWVYVQPPEITALQGFGFLHSTVIRDLLFGTDMLDSAKKIGKAVPQTVWKYLEEFKTSEPFGNLALEYGFIKDYKKAWEKAPYPPTFVTVDACVVQSGHVLVVKRRAAPGRGLYALPGGFLNTNERVEDAMLRELYEETKLKVPKPVLKGSIRTRHVFDHPERSLRGRTITHAFLIELVPGELPKVKGSDDAEKAFWMSLSEIEANPRMFFEDHWDMIMNLTGRI